MSYKKSVPVLQAFIQEIDQISRDLKYWTLSKLEYLKSSIIEPPPHIPVLRIFPIKNVDLAIREKYITLSSDIENKRAEHNKTFFQNEAIACIDLFARANNFPLTKQQEEAIIIDEHRHLVIAGAGTGKTSTLVTKICYLTERLGVPADRILALSFTKVAVDEMRNRLRMATGKVFNIRTINSFGYNVIRELAGSNFKVIDTSNDKFNTSKLGEIIEQELHKHLLDPVYFSQYLEFIIAFAPFAKNTEDYNSEQEQNRLTSQYIALDGGVYRSNEEIMIANFLFLHGIKFEYEKQYTSPAKEVHKNYKPDFYLTDYQIWIEHFALIDRKGNVPPFFKGSGKKSAKTLYNEQRNWKLQSHKLYGSKLVECFSYEVKEGTLLSNLQENLSNHGVNFSDPAQVVARLKNSKDQDHFQKLAETFINLTRSSSLSIPELRQKVEIEKSGRRNELFLSIIEPIFQGYEQYLRTNSEIDFADMVNMATTFIEEEKPDLGIDYLMIDEFQDLSVGQLKLIRAILSNDNNIKLFGVGDDWQSIYRFAGVDVSLITKFEEYFGMAEITKLETTFRFDQEIADVSSEFILLNPKQLKKNLTCIRQSQNRSIKLVSVPSDYFRRKTDDAPPILDPLGQIFEHIYKIRGEIETSILILGRFNHDIRHYWQPFFRKYHKYKIEYKTVHAAKGAEADYVILWNVNANSFPCSKEDDPVLNLVLSQNDEILYAEERRLFYVAMTRTRNDLFILYTINNFSPFIEQISGVQFDYQKCPNIDCNGILIPRLNGKEGTLFLGCSNFPNCRYSKNVLHQKKSNLEEWSFQKSQQNGQMEFIKRHHP